MLYQEYLDWGEVDVDFILRDGKLVYATVTDNHPTLEFSFAPTGINMPSRHSLSRQQQMIDDVVRTALAAGARNMVGHFEGKWTREKGDKFVLFDANPRVGGRPVVPLNEDVYGVDLIKEQLITWANIPGPPHVPTQMRPNYHVFGKVVFPKRSGILSAVQGWEELLKDKRVYKPATMLLTNIGAKITASSVQMDRVYVVSAKGRTAAEAEANYKALIKKYKLTVVLE